MTNGILFYIEPILAILVGLLACMGMIAAKQPNAGAAIAKLVPFQGVIGIVALIYSVLFLIGAFDVVSTPGVFSAIPVYCILLLAVPILTIILGFLFAWGLVRGKARSAQGDAAVAKIASMQGTLGVIDLIAAVLLLVFTLFSISV